MKRIYLVWLTVAVIFYIIVTPCPMAGTVNYIYDDAGRLTKVAYDDSSSITYSYDNAGNLLQRVVTVTMTLTDAIRVLQVLAQSDPSAPVYKKTDVDGDGQIELGEVIYILQKVSGLRQ